MCTSTSVSLFHRHFVCILALIFLAVSFFRLCDFLFIFNFIINFLSCSYFCFTLGC
jgi:hypothetical protein